MRKVELNPRFNGIIEHDLLGMVDNELATRVGDDMSMSVAITRFRFGTGVALFAFMKGEMRRLRPKPQGIFN